MDKASRNAIDRATQQARTLLDDDFSSQLEGTFDVLRSGLIAPNGGGHLSSRQRVQREKIVAAIEYKRAAGMTAAEAVTDYLRDAAFTTLNRFVALKMLEARELMQQCITSGEQSAGYREFCGMAPGVALLPDGAGYRLYIESLFDELSTEVKVLFDRWDPTSVLWPKRATFETFLEILNASELLVVWSEDETIGWVYQFFNSGDERRAMRESSQAPRDSRELAVRNQFFTPRYVVQFLTDNTLGRIWYEMRAGQTALIERCKYLVTRPDEIYPPRAKKDPRDIHLLDPACGSGHFLLYAFDLFVDIYEEAYYDQDGPKSQATGETLAGEYSSIDSLRKALPGLVLSHNLHGVEIDSRCAQIAQLSLWMRAQRAFRDFGFGRAECPLIRRSHIVVAEPLVTDDATFAAFLRNLGDIELTRMFTDLAQALKLAGDLGLLLRVERLLQHGPQYRETGNLFAPAESRIRAAITTFVAEAEASVTTKRRLFADDAAQGVGLLEISESRFDVVLMNPPFGLSTLRSKESLKQLYPDDWTDLYAAFLVRGIELCSVGGRVGAITSNLWLNIKRQETLRIRLSSDASLRLVADLGSGVLDDATVDTALTVVEATTAAASLLVDFCRAVDRGAGPRSFENWQRIDLAAFRHIPSTPFCFDLGKERLALWTTQPQRLDPDIVLAFKGNATFDNFRFLRCWWEVKDNAINDDWIRYDKGGEYQPFFNPTVLVWRFSERAAENRAFQHLHYATDAQVMQSSKYWGRSGLCYSRACMAFSPRILAKNHVVNDKSIALLPRHPGTEVALLGLLVSSHVEDLIRAFGDYRSIEKSAVANLPLGSSMLDEFLAAKATVGVREAWSLEATRETSPVFLRPAEAGERSRAISLIRDTLVDIDEHVSRKLYRGRAVSLLGTSKPLITSNTLTGRFADDADSLKSSHVSYCVGLAFGRWTAVARDRPLWLEHQLVSDFELPHCPPGAQNLPSRRDILPLDEGHADDLAALVAGSLEQLYGLCDHAELRAELCHRFFSQHLNTYSQSARMAPIYWQLATPSASYSVWLYLQAITKDTLYKVQNDFVAPKLIHEERRLESLRRELGEDQKGAIRKTLAVQETLVEELRIFSDEVKRIAPLWNPNLDDGVIINFAPLWRLVPHHKVWQKELKAVWDALCDGELDWAHLAVNLWPERVVPKCATDRSLAIAHNLVDVFWVEESIGKWKPLPAPRREVEELVRERTSTTVKAALKRLLEAPAVNAGVGRGRSQRSSSKTDSGVR